MATVMKGVGIKTDEAIIDKASEVLREHGFSLRMGLIRFLEVTALTGKVDLPSAEELENERLFLKLQEEIEQGINQVKAGDYYTDEDIAKIYEV